MKRLEEAYLEDLGLVITKNKRSGLYGIETEDGEIVLQQKYEYLDDTISNRGLLLGRDEDGDKVKIDIYSYMPEYMYENKRMREGPGAGYKIKVEDFNIKKAEIEIKDVSIDRNYIEIHFLLTSKQFSFNASYEGYDWGGKGAFKGDLLKVETQIKCDSFDIDINDFSTSIMNFIKKNKLAYRLLAFFDVFVEDDDLIENYIYELTETDTGLAEVLYWLFTEKKDKFGELLIEQLDLVELYPSSYEDMYGGGYSHSNFTSLSGSEEDRDFYYNVGDYYNADNDWEKCDCIYFHLESEELAEEIEYTHDSRYDDEEYYED